MKCAAVDVVAGYSIILVGLFHDVKLNKCAQRELRSGAGVRAQRALLPGL